MAWSDLLADKPEVPRFQVVDPTKEQQQAIQGNLASFAQISKLASSTNTFNQNEMARMLEMGSPGYTAMQQALQSRIGGFMNGEIPKDVQDAITRGGAQRSISGGFGGSDMARNLVARDLGLTSLGIMEKGMDAGSRWLAQSRASLAPGFDAASMFVTPQQRIQTKMFNSTNQFDAKWLKSQVDAATSDRTIISQNLGQLEGTVGSMLGSAAGGAMGGGGGGGGGGL